MIVAAGESARAVLIRVADERLAGPGRDAADGAAVAVEVVLARAILGGARRRRKREGEAEGREESVDETCRVHDGWLAHRAGACHRAADTPDIRAGPGLSRRSDPC